MRISTGNGVILSATWLLPIALIPGTWFENQFPKSPTMSPTPLPPEDLPASPSPPYSPLPSTPTSPAPTPSVPSSPAPSTPASPPPGPDPVEGEPPQTPSQPVPTNPDDPPEAEDQDEVPWSPNVGISPHIGHGSGTRTLQSSPSMGSSSIPSSPRSDKGGRAGISGHQDKRGWGRFQVLRGAPKGLFDSQSYAVAPSAAGSGWGETPPTSPKGRPLSTASSSPGMTSTDVWATPMSTPAQVPPAVLPGSPLMDELLRSKRVGTVELPSVP